MSGFTLGGVENYNQEFLELPQYIDPVIGNLAEKHPTLFYSLIPNRAFELGNGLKTHTHQFLGGLGDQAGLQTWNGVQISREASGTDPGWDSASYNPYKVKYNYRTIENSGFETSRETDPINIKDVRFMWQFENQFELITSFLADISISVRENFNREFYIKHAADANRLYVMTDGKSYGDNAERFTYDPFTTDAAGDNYLTFDRSVPISTLNTSKLDVWHSILSQECPDAAMGDIGGLPVFAMALDAKDVNRMVKSDAQLNDTYNYAAPTLKIKGYSSIQTFQNWAFLHDKAQPRFDVTDVTSTKVTAKRIKPKKLGNVSTIGHEIDFDPDYEAADLALAIVFLRKVFINEIPPAGPPSPGGGTWFGAAPDYNGRWAWLNIRSADNPFFEKGNYVSRFEVHPRPGSYFDRPAVFLYKRMNSTWATGDNIPDAIDRSAAGASVTLAADADSGDLSGKLLTVTLSSLLAKEDSKIGTNVTLASVGSADESAAMISNSSDAPTYVLAFATAPSAATNYTTSTTVTKA